jgi:hypothetical protein
MGSLCGRSCALNFLTVCDVCGVCFRDLEFDENFLSGTVPAEVLERSPRFSYNCFTGLGDPGATMPSMKPVRD